MKFEWDSISFCCCDFLSDFITFTKQERQNGLVISMKRIEVKKKPIFIVIRSFYEHLWIFSHYGGNHIDDMNAIHEKFTEIINSLSFQILIF